MELNRRSLLQGSATAATAALIAGGAALVAPSAAARPAQALRPPGAIAEDRFLILHGNEVKADLPLSKLSSSAPVGQALTQGTSSHISQGTSRATK